MNSKLLVIGGLAWAGTVAGAYYLGGRGDSLTTGGAGVTGSSSMDVSGSTGGGVSRAPWTGGSGSDRPAQVVGGPDEQSVLLSRLKSAVGITNALERQKAFIAALEGMDSASYAEAAKWLEENDQGMAGRLQNMLLMYAWGKKDPEGALAWIAEDSERGGGGSVLTAWAEDDPVKAAEWAMANPSTGGWGRRWGGGDDGRTENWNMISVINGATRTNPALAAQLVEGMEFGRARGAALDTVLDTYWRSNPTAAQQWAQSLTDERLRNGATTRVARRMADDDPQSAARWAIQQSDPSVRAAATEGVIERWARRDADAAGAWLNSLPKGAESDGPRSAFANAISRTDPEAAMAWAGTVANEEARVRAIGQVARDWMRQDADAARNYITTQPNIPEQLRNRVLEGGGRGER